MKKWLAVILWLLASINSLITAISINYPPTGEQLAVLNGMKLSGETNLWILRIITFLMLGISWWCWYVLISKVDKKLAFWTITVLSISPVTLILGLIHPIVTFKILTVSIAVYFLFHKNLGLKQQWLVFLILAVFSVLFNIFVIKNKPAIFSKLSITEAQVEVTKRFTNEDSLNTKIELPLWWRRLSYNKYFFVYKRTLAETLPFFDFESLFFQEVHPLEQKSVVMFYWIEFYLFLMGIYFFVKNKDVFLRRILIYGILLSWVNFVFSEGPAYLRLIYLTLPISLVISKGWMELAQAAKNKYALASVLSPIVFILIIFAIQVNHIDLRVRTQKWFDNRPLAYQFWFENLKKIDYRKYEKIQITTLIGDAKSYCLYYLGDDCNQEKYVFNSFDLSQEKPTDHGIYAGFSGEFAGPDFKNQISANWKEVSVDKGLEFVGTMNLNDNIADKFGNDIGLAVKK